jgi:alpha-glucosidase
MFLLTLRGTPTTYYGEEIGMQDGAIPPEFVQDPPALKQPSIAHIIGRDPERTPMQWDDSPNAGFARADVCTWLPVADNYTTCNVAAQERDPGSMLNFYRALVQLRKDEPALIAGAYASLDAGAEDVFAYTRTLPGANRLLIVLNFGAHTHTLDLSRVASRATIAIATGMNRTGEVDLAQLDLAPNQGLVLRIV